MTGLGKCYGGKNVKKREQDEKHSDQGCPVLNRQAM